MNQVQLMGRLTRDPEVSTVGANNTVICKLGIAYSEKRNNNEHTSFFDCVAFGKTAEAIGNYFKKGQRILIVGNIEQQRWQDNQGQNRSKITININRFDFIEQSNNNSNQDNNMQNGQSQYQQDTFNQGFTADPAFAPQENIPF